MCNFKPPLLLQVRPQTAHERFNSCWASASRWCFRLCEASPPLDLLLKPHSSHGNHGPSYGCVLRILACAASWLWWINLAFSNLSRPGRKVARQSLRSVAMDSQLFTSRSRDFKFTFSLSLYLSRGLPIFLGASSNCPYSRILGMRESSIRTTWPAHRHVIWWGRTQYPRFCTCLGCHYS